jgi:hypothetical protein
MHPKENLPHCLILLVGSKIGILFLILAFDGKIRMRD